MAAILEKEYKIYLSRLDEFIRCHQHEFVLIKGARVVDFFDSYEKALKAGLKSFGNVAFFIKEIEKNEERHFYHQRISSS